MRFSSEHRGGLVGVLLLAAFVSSCQSQGRTLSAAPAAATVEPIGNPGATAGAPTAVAAIATAQTQSGCEATFLDAVKAWTDVRVTQPSMEAIAEAIHTADATKPVRIVVPKGTYRGRCLYLEDFHRPATAPLLLHGQDAQIDCTDGNGQAIGLTNASYVGIEGFSIGPIQGYYGDSGVHISGKPTSPNDPKAYGQWQPSHHIVVRNMILRNLYRGNDGDQNPDQFESGCCDALKANQAEHVWFQNNRISRVARHGIDNVGVHHLRVCGNTLTDLVGSGFGMEAKGGSDDVIFENNTVFRVRTRGIVLGGEGSDNNYMWPASSNYEGHNEVARNNVVVNAVEGGIAIHGCQECAAVFNTVWVTPAYRAQGDRDMLRVYNSTIEGAGDLWGGPRRVGQVLRNAKVRVVGNIFAVADGSMSCALNANLDAVAGLELGANVWFNGGKPFPECGEGAASIVHYKHQALTEPQWVRDGAPGQMPDLRPKAALPKVEGVPEALQPKLDASGKPRAGPSVAGAYLP